MNALVAVPAGLVGLVVGSFVGVVIDRVPHGDSVVRPPSHCEACGKPLEARDNIPVVSYLLLRGKCRACGAEIPLHDVLVEIATGVLFAALALRLPTLWALPGYCVFAAGLVALSAIDLRQRRLPTVIVYWTAAIGGVLLVIASALTSDFNRLLEALIGAAGCFAAFYAVWFAVPKGMGFGDVRLAGLCGGFLGWLGLRVVPLGMVIAFLIAGLPALTLLILGKVNRKSQFPFGPYLALGALAAVLFGEAIIQSLGVF